MMPLCVSSEGALQVRVRVLELAGVAWMPRGTSLGTAYSKMLIVKVVSMLYTAMSLAALTFRKAN